MVLKTANGRGFETDFCVESRSTNRLYIHFTGVTLMDIVLAFGGQDILPFEGYPDYVVLESVSESPDGVNVDLKKQEITEEQTEVEHGEE